MKIKHFFTEVRPTTKSFGLRRLQHANKTSAKPTACFASRKDRVRLA
jgi:hypothetical protein